MDYQKKLLENNNKNLIYSVYTNSDKKIYI